MLLFADDQVTISNTKDNSPKAVYKLNQIITKHGLAISAQKTKLMAFQGQEPDRNKMVVVNEIREQVNSFNYFGNLISYLRDVYVDNKLNNHLKITGIINNMFRPQKTLKKTRIKITLPAVLYHSEK